MKLRKAGIITTIIFSFLMAFFVTAHSATEGERQEELGKAIQEAALHNQQRSDEAGVAQERLGQAIQEMAQASGQDGELQEQLGRQIQDSAVLEYAQGITQERMGDTLLQMARS